MQPTGYHPGLPAPNTITDHDAASRFTPDQSIPGGPYSPDPRASIFQDGYLQFDSPPPPNIYDDPLHHYMTRTPPPVDSPFPEMWQGAAYYGLEAHLGHGMGPDPEPPQNVGDYFPDFPVPAQSMDGRSTLPSAAGDIPSITAPTHAPRSSATKNRRSSKKTHDELQIIDCSGPPQKRRRKVNSSKPTAAVSESSNPAATGLILPPPLTLPPLTLPPLSYDETDSRHRRIIESAERGIVSAVVNNSAVMRLLERDDLVRQELTRAVTSHCLEGVNEPDAEVRLQRIGEVQQFSKKWTAENADSLYMKLSAPAKLVMAMCKKLARNKVERGYKLRPSAFSLSSEAEMKQLKINSLISDKEFPLKFIFGEDETGKLHPFEHEVVWDVVLDVVSELKYRDYVTDLDNLFCTAAAAVHCVLQELSSGRFVYIEFSAQNFEAIYIRLKNYIRDYIYTDQERSQRWSNFKGFTTSRLADIY